MKNWITVLFLCLTRFLIEAELHIITRSEAVSYQPNWDNLDKRPLPSWYQDAKVGIFIHWGVYSVPSFGSEWFWYNWKTLKKEEYVQFMTKNYPPNFTYQDFAPSFTAEFFDPKKWVELFQAAGARYIVLTSKHHDGYTLWPAKQSFSWNSVDVGPNRDIVGELAEAVRNSSDLKFGLYHSLFEWYNPLYVQDKKKNFTTDAFVTGKTLPELYDLVNIYRPEIIWSDGEWEASDRYWKSKEFIAWLYNSSPVRKTVVVNDRWGKNIICKHGDFFTCEDRYNPGVIQSHKWENCLTIDRRSWGYRRNANLNNFLTIEELIKELVTTVSCGGNILINVGPTKEGTISPIFQERLIQLGKWLNVNGEAIYGSRPWSVQQDTETPGVWYTSNGKCVYAIVLYWPTRGVLDLGSVKLFKNSGVILLGYDESDLSYEQMDNFIKIKLPPIIKIKSQWAFVFKFTNVLRRK